MAEISNIEKYKAVFKNAFSLDENELNEKLEYNSIPEWDSIGHMSMIADLEDKFDIRIETDDVINFNSYKKGIEILSKYGVQI